MFCAAGPLPRMPAHPHVAPRAFPSASDRVPVQDSPQYASVENVDLLCLSPPSGNGRCGASSASSCQPVPASSHMPQLSATTPSHRASSPMMKIAARLLPPPWIPPSDRASAASASSSRSSASSPTWPMQPLQRSLHAPHHMQPQTARITPARDETGHTSWPSVAKLAERIEGAMR